MKRFILSVVSVSLVVLGGCAPMRPTLSVSTEIHLNGGHVTHKPPVIKLEYKLEPETRQGTSSRDR